MFNYDHNKQTAKVNCDDCGKSDEFIGNSWREAFGEMLRSGGWWVFPSIRANRQHFCSTCAQKRNLPEQHEEQDDFLAGRI